MRLHPDNLSRLPPRVTRPGYDPAKLLTGIVHLGLGAFHRAHQAVYTEDALEREFGPWGIVGVSLRNPDTRDALQPQGSLYTVATRDGGGDSLRVVGAVKVCMVAPEDPPVLLATMCSPDIRIVSLTITEKGYCHDPATGRLNLKHPDILHDLADPGRPKSAIGFIVEALARRRKAGVAPFTVLSCDNLPHNGALTAGLVAAMAHARDAELGAWVEAEVAFPSTMVDRIVPATTDDDRALVEAGLGMADAWPVVAEPFKQWVIEDRFTLGRPAWDAVGAEFVADVAPYEMMKLRLLNGSHSSLAYLGYLGGFETIAETVAQPDYARHARALMAAAAPTVPVPPGYDLAGYQAQLMQRFANPALKHRTWQIAMDGSQKLPQRLLGTARDLLAKGAPVDRIALGVAAWMRYVTGVDERGQPISVSDPMAERLAGLFAQTGPDPARLGAAYLGVSEVFGDLGADPRFAVPVIDALARLYAKGARATLAEMP